jgi:hypothetical protein
MRVLNADASAHRKKMREKKKNSVFVFCCSLGGRGGVGLRSFHAGVSRSPTERLEVPLPLSTRTSRPGCLRVSRGG